MGRKFESAKDLLIIDEILPAEFFIKTFSNKYFDLVKRFNESRQISKK